MDSPGTSSFAAAEKLIVGGLSLKIKRIWYVMPERGGSRDVGRPTSAALSGDTQFAINVCGALERRTDFVPHRPQRRGRPRRLDRKDSLPYESRAGASFASKRVHVPSAQVNSGWGLMPSFRPLRLIGHIQYPQVGFSMHVWAAEK